MLGFDNSDQCIGRAYADFCYDGARPHTYEGMVKQAIKIVLGVATLLVIADTGLFGASKVSGISSPMPTLMSNFCFFVLLLSYIVTMFVSDRPARGERKLVWFLLLVLGGIFTMPFYWYIHIWRESTKSVEKMEARQDINELIRTLGGGDWQAQKEAALALGRLGDATVVEPLIEALKDPDWDVRWAALDALGNMNDTRAVQPIFSSLRDDDSITRAKATEALVKIGGTDVSEALVDALSDNNVDVRKAAAQGLSALRWWYPADNGERALFLLAQQKWDELVRLGQPAAEVLVQTLKNDTDFGVRGNTAGTLVAIGILAVESLIDALEDRAVRRSAIEVLGRIGDARAVEPVTRALNDEHWQVRREAARALRRIGDNRAVESLLQALKDSDAGVRSLAAGALGQIGEARAVESLVVSLNDSDSSVRRSVAWALGQIGEARAVGPLLQALKDEDDDVRWDAADALGAIRDPRAVEPLVQALKDKNISVRWSAASILGYIGDKRAVEPLIEALGDKASSVRNNAAWALGQIGDVMGIGPLYHALEDKNSDVRETAEEALKKTEMKHKLSLRIRGQDIY